jgi:hypothetical protein
MKQYSLIIEPLNTRSSNLLKTITPKLGLGNGKKPYNRTRNPATSRTGEVTIREEILVTR